MPQRHRQNFIGGLIEDNPLASGATTITSAALAAVDEVVLGTTYIPIVLDPDGIGGAPEIAYITAHAASATTATISRAEESTAAREHKQDIRWVHGPTSADFASDWALIEEIELSAPTPNITFSGIPDYFKDLKFSGELRSDRASNGADLIKARVGNSSPDSGTNYRRLRQYLNLTPDMQSTYDEAADYLEVGLATATNADAGTFSTVELVVFRYADTSRNRHMQGNWSYLGDGSNNFGGTGQVHNTWMNTASTIDTIQVFPNAGTNLVAGSYLALYGRGERRNP